MNNRTLWCFVLLLSFFVLGCSNPDAKFRKVTGQVTHENSPVAGALVSFVPVSGGEAASGTTDAGGKYVLTAVSAKKMGVGTLPGEYKIAVSKKEKVVDPDMEELNSGKITQDEFYKRQAAKGTMGGSALPENLLPDEYASPKTSGLTAQVTDNPKSNIFNFELK